MFPKSLLSLVVLMVSILALTHALSLPLNHSVAIYPPANITQAPALFPRRYQSNYKACGDLKNKLGFKLDDGAIGTEHFDTARASKLCTDMCNGWDEMGNPHKVVDKYSFTRKGPDDRYEDVKFDIRLYCRVDPGKLTILHDKEACKNIFSRILDTCTSMIPPFCVMWLIKWHVQVATSGGFFRTRTQTLSTKFMRSACSIGNQYCGHGPRETSDKTTFRNGARAVVGGWGNREALCISRVIGGIRTSVFTA